MYSRLIISFSFVMISFQLFSQTTCSSSHFQKFISFNEDFFFGQTNSGKWGLLLLDTSLVIKAEMDTIYPLCQVDFNPKTYDIIYKKTDFLIAKKHNKYLLFNIEGKQIFSVDGIMPRLMKNNIVFVKNNNYWGLIKTNGEVVFPIVATEPYWSNDMLRLKLNGNSFFFDAQNGVLVNNSELPKIQ